MEITPEIIKQMKQCETDAVKLLSRTRTKMIIGSTPTLVFFAALAMRLKMEPNWFCATAATDGKKLYYNPHFICQLTDDERLGVMIHEILHITNKFFERLGTRNLKRANIAHDIAINGIIKDAGLKLPEGGCFAGVEPFENMPLGKSMEEYYSLLPKDIEEQMKKAGGDGKGQTIVLSEAVEGVGAGQRQDMPEDIGGSGAAMPAGDKFEAAQREMQADWDAAAHAAARAARAQRGTMPGFLEKLIGDIGKPKINWADLLRQFVTSFAKDDYCVAPDTMILKSDLTWVRADQVQVGDKLIGVDENTPIQGGHRRVGETVVQDVFSFESPRLTVTTQIGAITVSTDHKFLLANGRQMWRHARKIKPGDALKMLVEPWTDDRSDSWLAGMYDGEGYISCGKAGNVRAAINLGVCQNSGPVLDRLVAELSGYPVKNKPPVANRYGKNPISSITISRISDVIKILGRYRPVRLLSKFINIIKERRLTLPRPGKARVSSISEAGVGTVVGIKTSSATLITNGLVSHNCWSRPNRRFISQGIYLPSLYSEKLGEILVVIDTSGSISEFQIRKFMAEVTAIIDCHPVKMTVAYHHTYAYRIDHWEPNDGPYKVANIISGGTSHQWLTQEWLDKRNCNPVCMICLTDLETAFPEEPSFPTFWGVIGNERIKAPFGWTVNIDISEE